MGYGAGGLLGGADVVGAAGPGVVADCCFAMLASACRMLDAFWEFAGGAEGCDSLFC